ncbi:oxalate/formate antiporter (macronuclear) [Tetrahymena thermophila SB210]|uniref:Oxalate/formate antiporter n=1 Tax=Tetrahymena thermophila (strain SB210) TaxID=312017 RepID=Q23UA7_TETTS|nr:oxalate/formate antiporter [Tetrahymena thermophila SB210]EAS00158.1 oxalate/formate antiporter [Tetrahymena thermophila SB210]|eukprot:XP_001020403.1 oxalate/formate antiporter [Tetrahymena thermophila SB210]
MDIKLSDKTKAIMTLIGGFLLLLMNGSIFLWGQLNVYVTSYFRQKDDPDLELGVAGTVYPVMMISLATGIPLGIKLVKLFGQARYNLLICSIISSLMVIISSYTQKFYQFAIVYAVLHGFAQGTIFFVPIYMGYLHFPNNRGLVAGVNTGGFALNSFFFGLLFFKLVNPNGLSQISNTDGYSYFEGPSVEVARNVPEALRTIGFIFLGVSVVASQMIMYHPNQIGEEEKRLKKELMQKENEKNDLQKLQHNVDQIDLPSLNKIRVSNQNDKQTNQANCIQIDQQILNKKLEILQLEEEVIQQKIELAHHQDKQREYMIVDEEISNKQSQKSDENQPLEQHQFTRLFKQELPNRNQHKNSFTSNKSQNTAQQQVIRLEQKEKQIEVNLDELKKRNILIEEQLNKIGAPSITVCLKQPQLYMSIFLGFLTLGQGLIVNGNYKSIAKDFGYTDDSFQSLVGYLGGIANGFCRPLWSLLLDKYPFKRILQGFLIVQIITSLTIQFTDSSKAFFAIWIFIIHMVFGVAFGSFPVFSSQLNGVKVGAQLYGLYWYGFSMANFLQFFLILFVKKIIGFNNIFYIYFGQEVLALLIITLYKFKVNWSQYYTEIPKSLQALTQPSQTLQTLDNQPTVALTK